MSKLPNEEERTRFLQLCLQNKKKWLESPVDAKNSEFWKSIADAFKTIEGHAVFARPSQVEDAAAVAIPGDDREVFEKNVLSLFSPPVVEAMEHYIASLKTAPPRARQETVSDDEESEGDDIAIVQSIERQETQEADDTDEAEEDNNHSSQESLIRENDIPPAQCRPIRRAKRKDPSYSPIVTRGRAGLLSLEEQYRREKQARRQLRSSMNQAAHLPTPPTSSQPAAPPDGHQRIEEEDEVEEEEEEEEEENNSAASESLPHHAAQAADVASSPPPREDIMNMRFSEFLDDSDPDLPVPAASSSNPPQLHSVSSPPSARDSRPPTPMAVSRPPSPNRSSRSPTYSPPLHIRSSPRGQPPSTILGARSSMPEQTPRPDLRHTTATPARSESGLFVPQIITPVPAPRPWEMHEQQKREETNPLSLKSRREGNPKGKEKGKGKEVEKEADEGNRPEPAAVAARSEYALPQRFANSVKPRSAKYIGAPSLAVSVENLRRRQVTSILPPNNPVLQRSAPAATTTTASNPAPVAKGCYRGQDRPAIPSSSQSRASRFPIRTSRDKSKFDIYDIEAYTPPPDEHTRKLQQARQSSASLPFAGTHIHFGEDGDVVEMGSSTVGAAATTGSQASSNTLSAQSASQHAAETDETCSSRPGSSSKQRKRRHSTVTRCEALSRQSSTAASLANSEPSCEGWQEGSSSPAKRRKGHRGKSNRESSTAAPSSPAVPSFTPVEHQEESLREERRKQRHNTVSRRDSGVLLSSAPQPGRFETPEEWKQDATTSVVEQRKRPHLRAVSRTYSPVPPFVSSPNRELAPPEPGKANLG
ncbi:hypothetical protein PG993_013569 [Apiospora rasikravindrae]|uniref:Uncharacterized protein n=1 Tax=Apiospora rasikravindrae TaxID=990691 RepID=A0ABR1RY01_9PEZI